MLKIIQETIEATRIQMDFEEAAILWPKIQEFVKSIIYQNDEYKYSYDILYIISNIFFNY